MTRIQQEATMEGRKSSAAQARPPLFVAQLPSNGQRIKRVLIANRGEIACRVIATCKKLNLTSIAVYVDEDATSLHISHADEAISLGSINQAGGNPFLNVPFLVSVAASVAADAVHPGYGYLSENGEFADAIRQASIIFIGPSSQAMSTLGDKRNSKEFLRKHVPSVPLIPGFAGSSQNIQDLEAAAEEIGFPVMLKASAGGGGRGMRIVRERASLQGELERAQSEAQRSFGSSDCILEKYIEAAKHVEVQIVGDSHGKVLSFWERECSVQRRHQKVIEETPSPFLNADQRRRMCATAVRIGELINYEGAGTVEFVVNAEDGSFYFLEVNTRLQVEHPITEEVTGIDLVALQLFAAAGGSFASLPALQNIPQHGHAIECRLCAEDPGHDFRPEHGTIQLWKEADVIGSRDIRYETAVQSGSKVSIHFDSMIAKVVVWAPTRELAIAKMARVMANSVCMGVRTNQLFLQSCLLHESFHDPAYTTSLIPTNLHSLIKNPHSERTQEMVSMLSVIPGLLLRDSGIFPTQGTNRAFKHVRRGFRNQRFDPVNLDRTVIVPSDATTDQHPLLSILRHSSDNTSVHTASLLPTPDLDETNHDFDTDKSAAYKLSQQYNAISDLLRSDDVIRSATAYDLRLLRHTPLPSEGSWLAASIEVRVNNSKIHAHVVARRSETTSCGAHQDVLCHFPALGTWVSYETYSLLSYFESLQAAVAASSGAASKSIKASMPCKVLSVLKNKGDNVKAGEIVMVIESMKMETNISVMIDGSFMTSVKQGDSVDDGQVLCWVD